MAQLTYEFFCDAYLEENLRIVRKFMKKEFNATINSYIGNIGTFIYESELPIEKLSNLRKCLKSEEHVPENENGLVSITINAENEIEKESIVYYGDNHGWSVVKTKKLE